MILTKYGTVYQLAFFPKLFPVNCYLVEEDDHLVLIDTGMSFCSKHILLTAEKLGKPIMKILLTHAHDDHVGSLDNLVSAIPEVEVMISWRDSEILAGNKGLFEGEVNLPIKGGVPKQIKTKPTLFLEDGQKIGSLVVIHTPGHTPGHMAFMDIRNNSLIAGDAMQTKGGTTVSGQLNWKFPFPALATRDKLTAIESVKRLLSFEPKILATGHGPVIIDPVPEIMKAIQRTTA